jgi:ribulose-5-phosphate 4-epimerase/fuculose-1-phosphate aldolase
MKKIYIIGGGTVFHVRPHLALSAPAYGKTVKDIEEALYQQNFDGIVHSFTTKMAGNRHRIWTARSGYEDTTPLNLETNEDVAKLIDELVVLDLAPKIIFMPVALCDFDVAGLMQPELIEPPADHEIGKQYPRLSSVKSLGLHLRPAEKVISRVRKTRKDIFLVGFKTTTNATKQAQFEAGLTLVKKASCNLVLANDLVSRVNMVITPEQAPYYVTTDRRSAITGLVQMAVDRSKGHFTRSEVHEGPLVAWGSGVIPESLRIVVNHCIKRGAYKPFMGKTVGHFALRATTNDPARAHETPPTFITSRRGVNFNELDKVGMVMVQAFGDDHVVSQGAKPSVGGQSQRIIFANHPDVDCIVHFHCPMKGDRHENLVRGDIPIRSQEPHECGSHECGKNTSDGLKVFELYNGNLKYPVKAVMLEKHGPNIVFNKNVDPKLVIDFIEKHWDLERSTAEVE